MSAVDTVIIADAGKTKNNGGTVALELLINCKENFALWVAEC